MPADPNCVRRCWVVLAAVTALAAPDAGRAQVRAKPECVPVEAVRRSMFLTELPEASAKALRFDAASMITAAVTTCGVEFLPECRLALGARYEPEARAESTMRIAKPEMIREALPTASADLLRHLDALRGGEIHTLAVGRRLLPRAIVFSSEVVGDCRRATHIVSQVAYGSAEVRGRAPDRFVFDGVGDADACASATPAQKQPPENCRAPFAVTLTRLAPSVLVAPNAHDASACKPDDPIGCTTSCALGNASGCTSLARQIEKASGRVVSAATTARKASETVATVAAVAGVPPKDGETVAPAVVGAGKATQAIVRDKGSEAAAALYGAACLAGQNLACNNLGVLRERGTGGPPDPGQAATLYEAACRGGLLRACNNLGTLLREGKGRPVNRVESLALFKAACLEDEPAACVNLGQQQLSGLGMPPDPVAALESFRKSCESGETLGCRNLVVAAKVSGRFADASAALGKACKSGVPGACAAVESVRAMSPPAGDIP